MTIKETEAVKHERLYSLDALRGFDMFCIIGGTSLFRIISKLTGADWLAFQLQHVKWDGFHFEDLIFPLFMFISGVSIPYSVKSKLENNIPERKLFLKVLKRMLVLILLGIIYAGALKSKLSEGRFVQVLGQIGIAYFFASLIVIYFKSLSSRIIWLTGLLAGYTIVQLTIPVPPYGAGILTPEGCINGYIDRLLLPGKLHGGTFDPEGILCSVSATGITLMGTVAGDILRSREKTNWQKIVALSTIGTGLIILALTLAPSYPIIKSCWTTTFNLLTGGISFILLAAFYLAIDHLGSKRWSFYFRIIGMNAIFIYMVNRFVNMQQISNYILGWISIEMREFGDLILIIGVLILNWLLLYYMYRKKIFLRV